MPIRGYSASSPVKTQPSEHPEPAITTTEVPTEPQGPQPEEATAAPEDAALPEPKPKRSRGKIVVIILLSVALAAAMAVLALSLVNLDRANATIKDQNHQLDEQRKLIQKKETFSAAMHSLLKTAATFDGIRLDDLVPLDSYQRIATQAWYHRQQLGALDDDIANVAAAQKDLEALQATATTQASTNISGTTYEATIDQLGSGYVGSLIDDADSICQHDVLACVTGDDPYTVHFDAAELSQPYMTDFLETGIAYHEFAHSLQGTNPTQTKTAVAAFGGDVETMADCFALTYVDGWALHQQIFVSSYIYYEVDVGYGYTCNDDQKAAIRAWYESLGIKVGDISQ